MKNLGVWHSQPRRRKLGVMLLVSALLVPYGGSTISHAETPAGQFTWESDYYTAGEDAGIVTLTVRREGGAGGQASVDFATADSSAYAQSDYGSGSGTLVFADGETVKTVEVVIYDDGETEGDESFSVGLSNPTGGAELGAYPSAAVSIADNDNWIPDPPSVLSFDPVSYTVGEAAGYAGLQVVRSGGAADYISVQYAASSGSAGEDQDYSAFGGTLSFAPGERLAVLQVPILDDSEHEENESFSVSLFGASGETSIESGTAEVTIADNDPFVPDQPGEFQLESDAYTAEEGSGTASIRVLRSGGADGEAAVDYRIEGGTAAEGADYGGTGGQLYFGDGETEKSIEVPITDDAVHEADEQFSVTLTSASNGAVLGSTVRSVVTIQDNDPAGRIEFSAYTKTAYEEDGTVSLTVTRSGSTNEAASVLYATKDYSALAGRDYRAAIGTLEFAAGEASKTLTVTLLDDGIKEYYEYFAVELSNPSGAELGDRSRMIVSLYDRDPIYLPWPWPRY
ncbi:Calx-beta domain-containing protein [Paenibacillus sp. S-38]|uniref:Calx-beta domain-containing protein n=1 Tax=Paenibacillus sp. S-38 TaxID=3416710 RepID=UPI003CF9C035